MNALLAALTGRHSTQLDRVWQRIKAAISGPAYDLA